MNPVISFNETWTHVAWTENGIRLGRKFDTIEAAREFLDFLDLMETSE